MQIKELRKKFAEDVNSAIIDASQKIAELRDKARVYTAILKRIDIRAPRAGTVQSVRVATIGGVIRPGQPLLDLVPDNDALVINVHVSPTDIDAVHPDMKAEVRFSSFHSTILPIIMGRVISVSRDRLTDEQSKQPYFLARVGVDAESLPPEIRGRIMAGMSADVIVPTGERTVVSYFVHPLAGEIFKAFREQ